MTYDLIIRNGTVVDGSGSPGYRGDVAVSQGRIAAIGTVRESASETIEADGQVVAPGFVDPHTHYDAQITWDPLLSSSAEHGVTTVVMGNCGVGIAPCKPADRELLVSISGVGSQTASTVLAELPRLDRVPSAQVAAAYAGLSPREFRSGSSVRGRTRLSKSGNARLRKALYLPTLTAIRFNPVLKGFFDRLVAAGKPKMQAVGACMRKLVMICYGVLKNRQPFDPQWSSRIAT